MPADNTSLKQPVLIIAAMLGALAVLVQPTTAEIGRPGSAWVDPVPSQNPSDGSLCLCAIISGYGYSTLRYGEKNAADLHDFIRDGRNSCHWLAQQESLYEGLGCVVEVYTYFTFAERCAEHAWRQLWGNEAMNSECLLLAPAEASQFPGY